MPRLREGEVASPRTKRYSEQAEAGGGGRSRVGGHHLVSVVVEPVTARSVEVSVAMLEAVAVAVAVGHLVRPRARTRTRTGVGTVLHQEAPSPRNRATARSHSSSATSVAATATTKADAKHRPRSRRPTVDREQRELGGEARTIRSAGQSLGDASVGGPVPQGVKCPG